MNKIKQTAQVVPKQQLEELAPLKDYEHIGVRPEDMKLYTHFKTKAELGQRANEPGAGKVVSQNVDDMMMAFTFMGGADLKDLITKDKSGGKTGKFERVNYMDKNEIFTIQEKQAKQNLERRAAVDGYNKPIEVQKSLPGSRFLQIINQAEVAQTATGFQRMENGMAINDDLDLIKQQNDAIAQGQASLALGQSKLPQNLQDSRALSEYYAELFAYTPQILFRASMEGDAYERFKIVIQFAFSVIHSMQLQDIQARMPVVPIVGETYEGHYMMAQRICDILMESDYCEYTYTDMLTGLPVKVSREQETTYITIQPANGSQKSFRVSGHLTYKTAIRNNNLIITLLGCIKVELGSQTVKIQLPEYALSNYINIDGKPRIALINGPLVLVDDENNFKAVVQIKGLVKKRVLLNQVYVANLPEVPKDGKKAKKQPDIIEGVIYKSTGPGLKVKPAVKTWLDFTSTNQITGVIRELARISGTAIDQPVIADVPYSDWSRTYFCDPIPAELALPSDIRFREDLICLKRGEKGKGKVWKNNLQKQQSKDKQKRQQ